MFDVDGTLVQSMDFDPAIFAAIVEEELGSPVNRNWSQYKNVTDSGILSEIIDTQGLSNHRAEIENRVKQKFAIRIEKHLSNKPAQQVKGAGSFLSQLVSERSICVSIATGGWRETTELKLKSAGLFIPEIPIATSSDHHSRTEIMRISKDKSDSDIEIPCTYFGDALWDKIACEELGYNFVLVGSENIHDQWIPDFNACEKAKAYIGL